MPAFHLVCLTCGTTKRKLSPKFPEIECCGATMSPETGVAASSMVKEVLDNGLMPRKVERLANIGELMRDRSKEPGPDDFI